MLFGRMVSCLLRHCLAGDVLPGGPSPPLTCSPRSYNFRGHSDWSTQAGAAREKGTGPSPPCKQNKIKTNVLLSIFLCPERSVGSPEGKLIMA